ncbi:AAA family ATPase [Simplicispira hankyongi]|uniref:AAA family ATPase n=1 Tax=Simplicispira hankyongi TaxID=2315688 RepID=A0A398CE96_9BURK|nr:AAA family ATPase [Simplicispira hankyongi]RID97173.1 AAA family ATPase [Simplicispira hankyongi]
MPRQDQRSKSPNPPGFSQRTFTYFARGDVHSLDLLLPISFTQDDEAAQTRDAQEQLDAHEQAIRQEKIAALTARRRQEEQEEEARQAQIKAKAATAGSEPFRSRIGDLDLEAELEFLKKDAKAGTKLARRSFAQALASKSAAGSQLFAKVFEWDEVMKLVGRVGATPDRDLLKRNKDLFLRIRKSHPHHMRPVGYRLHDHEAVLSNLAHIEQQLPHFSAVLALVRERLQLSFARQQPMHIPPILLLGGPGIGKTHFSQELARVLGLPVRRHAFDSAITEAALTGSEKRWANTSFGLLFDELVLGRSASPIILLDEIDKARSDSNGNALGPLHSLLEPVSAKTIMDISLDIVMDASHIVWVATANDPWKIPAPIRSRMHEFTIEAPTGHAALEAAKAVARAVHECMGSTLFDPPASRVIVSLAHLSARELIQALETGYARALAGGSRIVQRHHLPADILQEGQEGQKGDASKGVPDPNGSDPPSGGYLH